MSQKVNNVCVVVFGDIGRSPRMQYHALSLAKEGHKVDIIGYGETDPMTEIKTAPQIYYHYLFPVPQIPAIKLLNYVFKTIFQVLNLLFLFCTIRKPDVLIVQNPPAIPALPVCWLFCKLVRSKFIIDWHNYSYSIMALNLNKNHPLVRLTKFVEDFMGKRADHNFCVTKSMQHDLQNRIGVKAVTLYDRPPSRFKAVTLKEKHAFLKKLGSSYPQILCNDDSTLFTKLTNSETELKTTRPGILVSSTSWTEDEDFSVLLSALSEYETHHKNGNSRHLPDLYCFITGKGPLKEYYINKISEQEWQHVFVLTPWLVTDDYPLMLASADLGVSLHTSSSGLDLPMKVVDMFGCCLPVCAYDFECLNELVINGENSYTFNDSNRLCELLMGWFEQFPTNENQNNIEKRFKRELEKFQKLRWHENWSNIAYSAFK